VLSILISYTFPFSDLGIGGFPFVYQIGHQNNGERDALKRSADEPMLV